MSEFPEPDPLAALAAAALAGDPAGVRAFLKHIGPAVLRVVRQVLGTSHPDVEDVTQEAMLGTLTALEGFRGEARVGYFARRVALLTALNARRRHQLRDHLVPRVDVADLDNVVTPSITPADSMLAKRRRESFAALLDELPPPQAEAIALHCMLGYTIAETAEVCGAPVNTVRGRLVSAKAALRERLENDAAFEDLLQEDRKGGVS